MPVSAATTGHYDLVVVGAGSGGYVAAIRAAQLGLSVAVVEERYWGGVCLNTGCVPSKALLHNAEIASIVTHQADTFGISGDVHFDYSRAVSRSREVADARVRGVHFLMRKNAIAEVNGHGRFTDAHTLEVALSDGGQAALSFDNAVIATGAHVRMSPGSRSARISSPTNNKSSIPRCPNPSSSSVLAASVWNSPTSSTVTASTCRFSSTPTEPYPMRILTCPKN